MSSNVNTFEEQRRLPEAQTTAYEIWRFKYAWTATCNEQVICLGNASLVEAIEAFVHEHGDFAHKLPNIFKKGMDFAKIIRTSFVFKIGTLHSAAFPVALAWG